jgi:hypothetical protein
MIWEDFVINRKISDQEIVAGLVAVFGVSPDAVLILPDPMMLADPHLCLDGIQLICSRSELPGDFVLLLDLILRTPESNAFAAECGDRPLLQTLVDALDVEALADDGTINPYSWLHFRPHQEPRQAKLDLDQLDHHDAYV